MHVKNRARVKQHIAAIRRVAMVWRALLCVFTDVWIPCAESNRHFRSQPCFANHRVPRIRNIFASPRDVVGPVERYWEAWIMTVARGTAIHVNKTERHAIYVTWDRWGTFCRLTLTMYCVYFTILRPRKRRRIPTRQKNMCLTSSACNNFVRDVRKSMTVVSIEDDVAGEGINFLIIL